VPENVLGVLGKAVKQAVSDPDFVNASAKMQMPPAPLDAGAFKKWWDQDTEMLAAAIRRIPPPDAK
jgi:hypothetical protein